ncbi:MAG: cytidine deaminase [Deltaproteobacteria bacterium]|nr:cytidine deaminase [Deltaproteobacteria bacterium]
MFENGSVSNATRSRWSPGNGSFLLTGGPAPGAKPRDSFYIAGGLVAAFALGWLIRGRRLQGRAVTTAVLKRIHPSPISEAQKAELLAKAREAAGRGYRPYSKFPVGAALLTKDGRIFTGCNVENASYGLTQCAERAALTAAIDGNAKRGDFVAIALSTPRNPASAPINLKSPCGSCRQVMIELMGEDALVLIEGAGEFRVGELLPYAFRL